MNRNLFLAILPSEGIKTGLGQPKTRSGKIMRRILRKVGEGDVSSLGDKYTLSDSGVAENRVANRP